MTSEFDHDIGSTPSGEGMADAELRPGWVVGGGVNGGYLLATVGQAIRQVVPATPDPLTISAYYLSASRPGPAVVATRVLRQGGTTATVAAELSQGGTTRLTTLATYGELAGLPDDVATTAVEPELPPREECVSSRSAPEGSDVPPLLGRFDLLLDPATAGWAVGRPAGRGMIQAWFRLQGREPDPIALLLAVDALPPVTFELGRLGWAPTLELTVHVRASPAPGWLKVRHETRNVAGGMFEEDCEVWDASGRLVAQSRQLARLPRPAPAP